jgi:hypothetical protein
MSATQAEALTSSNICTGAIVCVLPTATNVDTYDVARVFDAKFRVQCRSSAERSLEARRCTCERARTLARAQARLVAYACHAWRLRACDAGTCRYMHVHARAVCEDAMTRMIQRAPEAPCAFLEHVAGVFTALKPLTQAMSSCKL